MGTDISEIRRIMEKNGSAPPSFETDDNNAYFLTIIPINFSFKHQNVVTNQEPNVVINQAQNVVRKSNVENDYGNESSVIQAAEYKQKKKTLMKEDGVNDSVKISSNVVKNTDGNVVKKQQQNVVTNDNVNVVTNDNVNVVTKTSESKLNDMQRLIYQLIKDNPTITAEELAVLTKRTARTIQRQIKILQDLAVLERVGLKKGGYWQVL